MCRRTLECITARVAVWRATSLDVAGAHLSASLHEWLCGGQHPSMCRRTLECITARVAVWNQRASKDHVKTQAEAAGGGVAGALARGQQAHVTLHASRYASGGSERRGRTFGFSIQLRKGLPPH
jgi:hypothetical protein